MWEVSPTLMRYDVTERTSADFALLGLKTLASGVNKGAKVSGVPFKKPIDNFYQTDVVSRAYVPFSFSMSFGISGADELPLYRSVTMAQCTRSFVKKEDYGNPGAQAQASYA